MASTVQPLRVCLRACRRTPNPQRSFVAATAAPRIRLQTPATAAAATARRAFSTTQRRPAPEEEEEDETADERNLTAGELRAIEKLKIRWDKMSPAVQQNMDRTMNMVEAEAREAVAAPRMGFKSKKFWNEDEEDSDLITDEQNEDMFDEDDIMSMAHGKFEEFREYREYARLAAWEMPLLSSEWPSFTLLAFAHVFLDIHVRDIELMEWCCYLQLELARPFEPPSADEPLRFRYTTYMGEFHPAENKVVVEFCPKDLPLDEAQQLKLKKLLGPRYNPETDIAKMSCEQFEHQAQNKRYLGDVINSLVDKAKVYVCYPPISPISFSLGQKKGGKEESIGEGKKTTRLLILYLSARTLRICSRTFPSTRDITLSRSSPSFPKSGA